MVVPLEIIYPDMEDYFKEIQFYNKPIEKPKIQRLRNMDLLTELHFYKELNIIKNESSV